jgi:hypothetical protein
MISGSQVSLNGGPSVCNLHPPSSSFDDVATSAPRIPWVKDRLLADVRTAKLVYKHPEANAATYLV